MTGKEFQKFCAELHIKLDPSSLVLISIATKDENGDVVFTAFNPHMRECRCESCKLLVEQVKDTVSKMGIYGEMPV